MRLLEGRYESCVLPICDSLGGSGAKASSSFQLWISREAEINSACMLNTDNNALKIGEVSGFDKPLFVKGESKMKLFSLNISPKDRAIGRFKSRVNRALVKAVITAKREKNLPSPKLQIKWESISPRFPEL